MNLDLGSLESKDWTLCVTGYRRGVVVYMQPLVEVADAYPQDLFRDGTTPYPLDQFHLLCLQVDSALDSSLSARENVDLQDVTLGLSESFVDQYCEEVKRKLGSSGQNTAPQLFFALSSATENTQIGDTFLFREIGCFACDIIWLASRAPMGMLAHKKFLIELLCTNPGKEQVGLLFTKYFTQWHKLVTAVREYLQSEKIEPREAHLLLQVLVLLDVFLHSLRAASHEQVLNVIISQMRRIHLCTRIHSSWANEAFQLLGKLIERYQNDRSRRFSFYVKTISKVVKEQSNPSYLQEIVMKAQKNAQTDDFPFDIMGVSDQGVLVIRYSHKSDDSIFACAIGHNKNESDWKVFWFRSIDRSNDSMYLDEADFGEFIALLQAVIVSMILRNAQKYKKNSTEPEMESEYDFCCFTLEDRQVLMSLSDMNMPRQSDSTPCSTNVFDCFDSEGKICEISAKDSNMFQRLQSGQSEQQSIEDTISAELVKREKTWVHLVGDLGNQSTSMAVRLLQATHHRKKLSTSENLSAFVEAFKRARRTQNDVLEKISTDSSSKSLDDCEAILKNLYKEITDHLESFRKRRSNFSVLIISDCKSKLDDYANLCTQNNVLIMPISSNFDCGEGSHDSLTKLRSKLWRLLIAVEHNIWESSFHLDDLDEDEQGTDHLYSFPVECYASCFSSISLPGDDRPVTQDVLDQWLNGTSSCSTRKITREKPPALFRIPSRPPTCQNPLPTFPSKSATKAERKNFVRQCLIYHSCCLQRSYYAIVNVLQDIKTVEDALCLRWKGMDAMTSKAFYVTTFFELHKPSVRWIINRQDPSILLVDCERENNALRLLGALFSCTTIYPRRCSIVTVSVEKSIAHPYDLCIQYQEKHPVSQGVMKLCQACAQVCVPQNNSDSMMYEEIVERSGTGIEEDAFVWTTPACDANILMDMLFKLGAYIYSAKPTWKTRIVVSDELMGVPASFNALKSFTEARPGLEICGISYYKSALSDAHILLLTNAESFEVRDLLKFVKNTKYSFYAITHNILYRRILPPQLLHPDFQLGGPVLHMRCAKGHNSARRHAFVDFRKESEGSHAYKAYLDNIPEYGKWCPMLCLRSFKECSSPGSHLCKKKCIECTDDHSECAYPCPRIFDCGHSCPKNCGEKCNVCEERVIVECDCPGSWVVAGYNMDTQKVKYEKVSHYRELLCHQLLSSDNRTCSSAVAKPCSRCGEFTDLVCGAADVKTCARCDTMSPNVLLLLLKRNRLRSQKLALILEIRSHKARDTVDSGVVRCPEWEKASRWKSKQKESSEEYENRQSSRRSKEIEDRTQLISFINRAKDSMVRSSQVIETYLDLALPEKCEDIELHGL